MYSIVSIQEPRKQGFRAVVVSPSRELAQQTYREFVRLADGRGFRVHTIDNTGKAAKKFGPQSAGKFGKSLYKIIFFLGMGILHVFLSQ